jgi:hypothetical protein
MFQFFVVTKKKKKKKCTVNLNYYIVNECFHTLTNIQKKNTNFHDTIKIYITKIVYYILI